MRTRHWINFLFLAVSISASAAMAADKTSAAEQIQPATKLEKISNSPAGEKSAVDDCPMHHGKKECDHKKGETCPHHQNEEHHGKMHDKCDQKHHN